MGLFDAFSSADERFIDAFEKIADSIKTVADAYAEKNKQPTLVVNVTHDGDKNINTYQEVAEAVKRGLRNRGVQDR